MSKAQKPIQFILSQINKAKKELDSYSPSGFGWFSRANATADLLVPWLTDTAPELKEYIQKVLNSRHNVRIQWAKIIEQFGTLLPAKEVQRLTDELAWESILISYVGGDLVSKVIEKYLIENFKNGVLESNGKSDYPDLFLRSQDYTGLPKFGRKDVKKFGAALKGDKRPVRVPDGLEVKTCRGRLAVDCHFAHVGLHLVLLFHEAENRTIVDDILIAFLRYSDYRITKPKTGTTTLKASFNGECFISLFD